MKNTHQEHLFIGNSTVELRAIIVIAVLIAFFAIPIILLTKPTLPEKLTRQGWCVDSFEYKEVKCQTNTTGLKLVYENGCTETFQFFPNP